MSVEPRWVMTGLGEAQQQATAELAQALAGPDGDPFPLALAQVLVGRGISSYEAARAYFHPDLSQLPDVHTMAGLADAVTALRTTISAGKPILVYGDYDVDGTTAVALVSHWFTRLDVAHDWYVPDRSSEGYGLSESGVRYAAEIGAGLILALDCGITAHARAEQCRALGIALVIVDHHQPADTLPAATAVIDPLRADCAYPFKLLTGCGLANRLLMALAESAGWTYDPLARADLVALSTACDIVPVVGENRLWVHHGLEVLRTRPLPGLAALMLQAPERNGRERRWTVSDLVFYLGPRLNAAGRLHHARATVELLLGSEGEAESILAQAESLDAANRARQALQAEMVQSAIELAEAAGGSARRGFVLWHPDWHAGVVGIVAAKLVERYHRPTILLSPVNGVWKGSGRSVAGFDLYAALNDSRELLVQFGGHAHAAGLSVDEAQLEAFAEAFERLCAERVSEAQLAPELSLDAPARLSDFTPKFTRLVQRMEPYGPGNLRPVFHLTDLRVQRWQLLSERHLKLALRHGDGAVVAEAIGFDLAHRAEAVGRAHREGLTLEAAATPDFNTFRGATSVQLLLKDVRLRDSA